MTEAKKYKDSLNLPKTSFPMKANLAVREPEILAKWEAENLYGTIRQKAEGQETFLLHDGPPYANGHIHIGHALNKILKDMIVKYQSMRGHDAHYVPGWDCHGLPIEYQCLKNMGKRKEDVERVAFRKEARKYAEKFVEIQREEFKRLGVFGDWDKPYLTMDYEYQAAIAESFLRLAAKDYIYQGLKPVPWCFDCETALADAELEYEDKTSTAVFVKFEMTEETTPLKALESGEKAFFLIWTTTPWTLPANVGIAVHPDLDYVFVKRNKEVFILAESLWPKTAEKFESQGFVKIASQKGKALEKLKYQHPFLARQGKVICADYVSAVDGTGIVHIAPGHGEDDFRYGHVQNGLDVVSPVDSKGRFTKEFEAAEGLHVFKGNAKVTEILESAQALLSQESYGHSYPHCWRCKKPIIFRATKQWFMKVDHDRLRQNMLDEIDHKIRFTPDWGKRRIGSMVESRPEWCLSRQRYWGVPIPMIRCTSCEKWVDAARYKSKVSELFRREGADSWFSREAADFLPSGHLCACGGKTFEKEEDIIDVWFDSGVSHQAVLHKREGLAYPSDLYLEGSDQHRGWFQSSLTTAMALEGESPFKGVLTHGFVVDGAGKKMSKSAGNVVSPQDVMKHFGVDILRLWVSSCDYQFDVRLSQDILKQLADSYRKIRNTFRYMLGNLHDFDAKKDLLSPEKLHPLDQWAAEVTNQIVRDVLTKYDRYEFHQIYQRVHKFCVIELSGYYFDVLKDILYTFPADSKRRRSAQTTLFYILSRIVKVLAPILPFTTEEVWGAYPIENEKTSVHVSELNDQDLWKIEPDVYKQWADIYQLRNAVTPFLEKKREEKMIGSNLDAKIEFQVSHEATQQYIHKHLSDLEQAFVVSQVCLTEGGPNSEQTQIQSERHGEEIRLSLSVQKADGKKCVRCWKYTSDVGKQQEHPGLCGPCFEALGHS